MCCLSTIKVIGLGAWLSHAAPNYLPARPAPTSLPAVAGSVEGLLGQGCPR